MQAVVLVATHDTRYNSFGTKVPMPLVDVAGEVYLTTLIKRLVDIPQLNAVHIIVNEAIRGAVEEWHRSLPPFAVSVTVVSDGTLQVDDRKGAIGDLIFAIDHHRLDVDLVVVGGDNWVSYDLVGFVEKAKHRSPAVIVTRIAPGPLSSRFGWVELDETERIVKFLEHSEHDPSHTAWKASCVYYLNRNNLKCLQQFANEQSTVCSPGTFFAWLADRIAVYGIAETGRSIGTQETQALRGADFLEWREAARSLKQVSSHVELMTALSDSDPNVRIVAARLLGQSRQLLSESARQQVISALLRMLNDPAANDVNASPFECDEDAIEFVSATAAASLAALRYAGSVPGVFEKAKNEGWAVCERRNKT